MNKSGAPQTETDLTRETSPPPINPSIPLPGIIEKADVVVSLGGRDKGKRFIVMDTQGEYSFLADGKGRKVVNPKKKKNKHLILEDKALSPIAEKLSCGTKVTNNELRRALAQYAEKSDKGGM